MKKDQAQQQLEHLLGLATGEDNPETTVPESRLALERAFSGMDIAVPGMEDIPERIWSEYHTRKGKNPPQTPLAPRERRCGYAYAAALLAGILLMGLLFFRRQQPVAARIQFATGTWQISNKLLQTGPSARRGLHAGAILQGNKAARLDLGLPNGGHINVQGQARLTLEEFQAGKKDGRQGGTYKWRLNLGRLHIALPPDSCRRFAVATPHALFLVTGTHFTLSVTTNHSDLFVKQGRVRCLPLQGTGRSLGAGQGLRADIRGIRKQWKKPTPGRFRSQGNRANRAPTTTLKERIRLSNGMVISGNIISQDRRRVILRTPSGLLRIPASRIRSVSMLR